VITRSQLLNILKHTDIEVNGTKINKKDFRKIFGARYVTPEWMVLIDYQLESPEIYLDHIEIEEDRMDRIVLPASCSITKFGDFVAPAKKVKKAPAKKVKKAPTKKRAPKAKKASDGNPDTVALIGLVYQYSLKRNPRNVHYAHRLFLGIENLFKNSGFSSLDEAKAECSREAKNLIETQLFDLT